MPDSNRQRIAMPRRFAVIDDTATPTFYPSYDIALLAGEQARLQALLSAVDRGEHAGYDAQRRHARVWFGARVQAWLQAGMPARPPLPPEPEVEAIEPRILARNGVALARYVAAGPGGETESLYDRLIARYVRAVHGERLAPEGIRSALEPIHGALALRRLWREVEAPRIGAYDGADIPSCGLSEADAVAMLRRYARLYRGLGPPPGDLFDAAAARAKWRRFCRRAVLLPRMRPDALFDTARDLWRLADIRHGLDLGDDSLVLRRRLLHLAQWRLTTDRRLPADPG